MLMEKRGNLKMQTDGNIKKYRRTSKTNFTKTHKLKLDQSVLKEVQVAIKSAKDGKALGPHDLPADVLKLIEEQYLGPGTILFNNIYETGIIPEEWLRSTFVAIPKKQNDKKC